MLNGEDFKRTNDTKLDTLPKILRLANLFTFEITVHTNCDSAQQY